MTRPGKISTEQAGFEPRIFRSRGGRLNHWANEAVSRLAEVQAGAFLTLPLQLRRPDNGPHPTEVPPFCKRAPQRVGPASAELKTKLALCRPSRDGENSSHCGKCFVHIAKRVRRRRRRGRRTRRKRKRSGGGEDGRRGKRRRRRRRRRKTKKKKKTEYTFNVIIKDRSIFLPAFT